MDSAEFETEEGPMCLRVKEMEMLVMSDGEDRHDEADSGRNRIGSGNDEIGRDGDCAGRKLRDQIHVVVFDDSKVRQLATIEIGAFYGSREVLQTVERDLSGGPKLRRQRPIVSSWLCAAATARAWFAASRGMDSP